MGRVCHLWKSGRDRAIVTRINVLIICAPRKWLRRRNRYWEGISKSGGPATKKARSPITVLRLWVGLYRNFQNEWTVLVLGKTVLVLDNTVLVACFQLQTVCSFIDLLNIKMSFCFCTYSISCFWSTQEKISFVHYL